MTEKLMNTKELSAHLGIAVSTLLLYRSEGTGPRYIKMGRLVRYRVCDVEAWLAERDGSQK
jgi:predicted DNA-binding transcriptional regulator AlpA